MILKELMVGLFGSNCFIVGCERTKVGLIIDPGADGTTILKTADSLGLKIHTIVATHNHLDHVGAMAQVKDATKAAYLVHEYDAESMTPSVFGRMMGLVMSHSFKAPPKPDRLLRDGDLIEVGDLRFTVLHTPGHTRGGISLLGDGIVFSGDTLFNLGIGRTDLPSGNHSTLINSIVTRLMSLPDDTIVYPGHGPRTTIGYERVRNPFLVSSR